MENLIKDSISLLKNLLSDTFGEYLLTHIANVTQSKIKFPDGYRLSGVSAIYGYDVNDTPGFLENEGVLRILSSGYLAIHDSQAGHLAGDSRRNNDMLHELVPNKYKKFTGQTGQFAAYTFYMPYERTRLPLKGLHWVVINRRRADDWVSKIENRLVAAKIQSPDQRNFWYESQQLKFKLKDGSFDQVDFSKAKTSRELFEAFWHLWKAGGSGEYSRQQIANMYQKLFDKDLQLDRIGEIVSNIRKSMINPVLTNLIEWKWDRKKNAWIFKITF